MKKTKIQVDFHIYGSKLIPQVVSEKLGISPTRSWVAGDEVEIQGKVRKRRFNHWEISTGYEESDDMKKQLIKIVDLLKDKIDILNQLRDQYDLEFIVDIVPVVENKEQPGMYFDHWFIEFVHAINATVDIDLYINS